MGVLSPSYSREAATGEATGEVGTEAAGTRTGTVIMDGTAGTPTRGGTVIAGLTTMVPKYASGTDTNTNATTIQRISSDVTVHRAPSAR